MYCEDSVADEVEHFRPKDLYPDVVFAWRNYLYACGQCNGGKNNRFSIVRAGHRRIGGRYETAARSSHAARARARLR